MKIAKSAPISGTRPHGYGSSNYEWQSKKNPHAKQGTGNENQSMLSVPQTGN